MYVDMNACVCVCVSYVCVYQFSSTLLVQQKDEVHDADPDVCFQTGTLTEDGLNMQGVVPAHGAK